MDFAYDTETYKKGKNGKYTPVLDATGKYFLVGSITNDKGESKIFLSKEEMWKYIIETGKKLRKNGHTAYFYAHNSKYDFFNIYNMDKNLSIISEFPFIAAYYVNVRKIVPLEEWEDYQTFLEMSKRKYSYRINTDSVDVDLKEEAIRFIDSMGLFRMPLRELGKIIGLEKLELPQEVDKKELGEMLPYVTRDTEILIKAVKMLKEKLKADGIGIKRLTTMNQIAISYLVKMIKELKIDIFNGVGDKIVQSKARRKIRKAYRGGRVEAWKTGITKGVSSIDCNSLYPYAASIMKFPNLKTEVFWNKPNKEYWGELLGKVGICRAMMYNKDCELGFLPVRLPHLSYYPRKGKYMIGTWTNGEIMKAVEEGYKIIDIQFIINYEEMENPFGIIMPKLYSLRKTDSIGDFNKEFYKSIMNGGIGKFAQIKIGQEIVFDNVEKTLQYKKDNWESLGGINDRSRIIKFRNTTKDFSYKSYYCPLLSALITAQARMVMYDVFKKVGKDKLVYTDTDSCAFIGKVNDLDKSIKIGTELGQFKVEFEEQEFECWGRKAKRIGDMIRLSGVSRGDIKEYDKRNRKIKFRKMQGLKKYNTGEFVEDIRDLDKQVKDYEEQEKILEEIGIYIDNNIMNDIYNTDGKGKDDILYFRKELDKLNTELKGGERKDL